jgi:hypothetical protein
MSGPSTSTSSQIEQSQQAQSQQQFQLEQQQFSQSQANQAQMQTLEAPAIDFYTKMTTNANTALQAAAPQIGQIDSSMNAAKQNILNTIAPGASRDYALSQLQVQQGAQTAGLLNTETTSAYDKLANLGAGIGAFSLGQGNLATSLGGLGTTNLSGAAQTQQGVMNTQEQAKAGLESMFGSLLGGAGSAVGGFLGNPNLSAPALGLYGANG